MGIHARIFNQEKAIEATLFIAKLLPRATMHSISKMFYLADKLHLQEYGRLICGDVYIKMEYGPVPSTIYDYMKIPTGGHSDPDTESFVLDAFSVANGFCIVPKREAETSFLSESEIECIEKTVNQYGRKNFGELTEITHDAAWTATEDNKPISLLDIAKTLPNASEIIAYLEAY